MGYYDFPHTKMYDGDLGYLIKKFKELLALYKSNNEYLEQIYQDIQNITEQQLEEWLADGTLENIINQTLLAMTNVSTAIKEFNKGVTQ